MSDEQKKDEAVEATPAPAEEVKEEKKEEVKAEEKQEVEVPKEFKTIVKSIEKLSVLQLAELVKVLEEKFGVSAAAPVAMMAAGGAEDAVEKSNFDIELAEAGGNKIAVIKLVKELTGLGLKEAKDMVDAAPKVIKEGVDKAQAEEIKAKIEAAGGKANLK